MKFARFFWAFLAAAMVFCCLAACSPDNGEEEKIFKFTTSLTDGASVTDESLTFTVSATYGGEACEVEVKLNGVTVEGVETYTVQLAEGENIIKINAKSGEKSESKEYKVTYTVPETPAVFMIATDLESAAIKNDVIVFTASATCNESSCNVAVTFNGAPLNADNDGKYSATLSVGENVFNIIARNGDDTDEKSITINYEGIEFATSLTDCDVTEKNYSFTASATYGGDNCELEVSLNGEVAEPSGSRYNVTLLKGENTISVSAVFGRISKEFAYIINYQTSAPTISASITDNLEIRSDVYNFEVIAHDSAGNNISSTATFAVDWNANDNVENFESVNGISVVWSDSDKTSYRIDFKNGDFAEHTETAFVFKITATDSLGESVSVEYKLIYIPAEDGESTGKVVFSIEGFTIGMGYFVEPMRVPIYNGVNGAQMLADIIEEQGWTCDYSGRIEKGFYLETINGLDLTGNEIPDELWTRLESMNETYDRTYDESENERYGLGEFCYGRGSGWMYSVNGVFYNYGFSDYVPQNGDVIRVVFTLFYGADVGGSGGLGLGGDSWLDEDVDYAEIMTLLADIKSQAGIDLTVYNEVVEHIGVWNISQADMDKYLEELRTAYGRYL